MLLQSTGLKYADDGAFSASHSQGAPQDDQNTPGWYQGFSPRLAFLVATPAR